MFADVIVDIVHSEVDKVFEYSFNADSGICPGCRVCVPFGNKFIEGFVINVKNTSNFNPQKIKPIVKVLDSKPVLTQDTLQLMHFISKKYYVSKAQALRLFLPSEMRKGKVKEQFVTLVSLNKDVDSSSIIDSLRKSAKKQIQLIEFLSENSRIDIAFLNKTFGNSSVNALLKRNLLTVIKEKANRLPYENLQPKQKDVNLSPKQTLAVNSFFETDKRISLLFGVTGSGKTEVYLNIIQKTINQNKNAIMLVPEISLTPQMFSQLKARFGSNVAILHSGLSAGEKFDEWWRLRNGQAKIAVGARSAIFAPLDNIGVIIIDEEHDGSYVSDSSPRYVTIDVANKRAELSNAKIIIGSATPSLESFKKAQDGIYNLIELPDRINKKPLPFVEIADMRKEVKRGNNSYFSSLLKSEITACLENKNQVILFLNRRGYSKTVICTECGHVQKCDSCDVSLTYHREDNSLLCHYCGAKYKMIEACTECGSTRLNYGGVGTERIVEDLQKLFPTARILRMDRDTTQNKEWHYKILSAFGNHEADILVGTQMIAKGHDFPSVTLVGILDADASLYFSDYRSAERTFQLITQVAGRSGRADMQGKVVLQTYQPENNLLRQALNYDYKNFYEQEISLRKATAFPPFADIVRILISSENEQKAIDVAKQVYNNLKPLYEANKQDFKFFGCFKCPLKRLQNKFRYEVLIRVNSNTEYLDKIFNIADACKLRDVNVVMELNPNNLS